MTANHHLLAKITTDAVLSQFKTGAWTCCSDIGPGFYRTGCESTFPSPDAAFYDDSNKLMVTFEFKPPTENKRGILTGLGQSIAYLNSSNISYLVIPRTLEDFGIADYMKSLFLIQIEDRLPVGLIVYDNDNPTDVALVHNVNTLAKKVEFDPVAQGRFWAKHLDMPIPLFHLILHFYYLKRIGDIDGDAFAACWKKRLLPTRVIETLTPTSVVDLANQPIKTLAGRKNIVFFEKKIKAASALTGEARAAAIARLERDADTTITGDNYYNSLKKNLVTFLKHVGAVDSTGSITDLGFKLYHLGLVHGPNSKIFRDYFTNMVLTIGHHIDLIFDLDALCNKYRGKLTMSEVRSKMLDDYEARGMIKRNPGRKAGDESAVGFLKYEVILWNSLGLTIDTAGKPETTFNWRKITEVCSLPEL